MKALSPRETKKKEDKLGDAPMIVDLKRVVKTQERGEAKPGEKDRNDGGRWTGRGKGEIWWVIQGSGWDWRSKNERNGGYGGRSQRIAMP